MYTEVLSLNDLVIFSNSFEFKKIILIIVGIASLVLISKLITVVATQLSSRLLTKKTLIFQASTIFTFFFNVFGSIYIFYKVLNPPNELLIAFIGSATFAVGFALKDLVSSLISGVMIIIDPPFQVGDRVSFKTMYGEIKHIGLRAVRLSTNDNQIITIPNSSFIHEAVSCVTNGEVSMNVNTDFYFNLNSDIKKIKEIIHEIVITSKYAYLNKPIIMSLNNCWQQDKLCLKLTVRAYVLDSRFEKDFQTDLIFRVTQFLSSEMKKM